MANGDSPDPNELVRQGWWPYAPNSPIQLSALTTPLQITHPLIQSYFLRCFNEGHQNPSTRPSAQEWVGVLRVAIAELKRCRAVKNHFFSKTDGRCYWCARQKLLGVDVFPMPSNQVKKPFARTVQRGQTQVMAVVKQVTQPLPIDVVRAGTTVLQGLHRWQIQTQHWMPQPKSPKGFGSRAIFPPIQISLPARIRLDRVPWLTLAGGMIATASLFAMSAATSAKISSSSIEREEVSLTLVGLGLCLGLVAFCWVLLRVTSKTQR
jgi:hypothetical protein